MPDKAMSMERAGWSSEDPVQRPVMLTIAGDSAAGKTTLTKGLVEALGEANVTAVCADDYHRYDREERKTLPFTPLNPKCNYIEIMEQHLELLANGQPILKPKYDHSTGTFGRPEFVEARRFVIVEGLLPMYTRLAQACADVTVYLDPPEAIRRAWKIARDSTKRGYTKEQVVEELERREAESAEFIRPQRAKADIVVSFGPLQQAEDGLWPHAHAHEDSGGETLSATLLLRPTVTHPDLTSVLTDENRRAIHLKLIRDDDGKPVDALHVHGHAPPDLTHQVEEALWRGLEFGEDADLPQGIGGIEGVRNEPLAVTQLILVYHLLQLAAERR
ncbi:MAG: phosphoribulokinase [Candidatus Dormibacteraeota bacterium]|uniref:Phosphoribulokinase n=1 Tax=Candidatus Amunia macphersoniae TaxID=3127014 RepID=A0A934N8X7_9BACT|nr:phosphoribulokinase [Candidatus Dormibacteraeota bacterium]